jgi:Domain of unknown function (DUF4265)
MKHLKIYFEHENAFEGGVGIESAWGIFIGENKYKLDNLLFYAKEYALGDILNIEEKEGELYAKNLFEESGHSLIRILFNDVNEVEYYRLFFKNMLCESEGSDIKNLVAFDIPPEVDYSKIKVILEEGELSNKWTYEEACLAQNIF